MQSQIRLGTYYRYPGINVEQQGANGFWDMGNYLIYGALLVDYIKRATGDRINGENRCSICKGQALS
jgi:hypothetical protein